MKRRGPRGIHAFSTFTAHTFASAVIALSLYFSGYVAEILRGAIGAIPSGQAQGATALGMRERVEMVGGTFEVESEPGNGTTIRAQIPFDGRG